MTKINLLIADDHKIIRDGIISLLSDESDLNIVDEAENGLQVIKLLDFHKIDIVVMDISMPEMNGIECTKMIKEKHPEVSVLILSMFNEEQYVKEAFNLGASGYILKDSGKEQLIEAIRVIFSGKVFYSPEIMKTYIEGKSEPATEQDETSVLINDLTGREIEVLGLILNESSNQEIAAKLFISIRTVDAHRRNLLNKTGAKNTAGLVKFAIANNLFR
jgi:DNA-binding NarL/FixJ family response regulator